MTPFQYALWMLIACLLIADVIYTRRMIAATKKQLAQTLRVLRSMGYVDPGEDEPE